MYEHPERQVRSVALQSSRSFDGDVKALKSKRVDALVTGSEYHDAQELAEAGIFTADAGHYHTEKCLLREYLRH